MGSPGIIKSPVFNMAFLLVTMQLSKRIDWENPDTLLYARVSYYGAQVLVCLLTFALMQLVKKRNDLTPLRYTPQAKPSLTNPQPAAEGEMVTTTNMDYDVGQLKQFMQSTVSSIVMISAMHWYFKFTQPLVLQSILPIKNLLTHKVALIHLWGDAPEGALQRPFQVENPLASFLGGGASSETPAQSTPVQDSNHAKKE